MTYVRGTSIWVTKGDTLDLTISLKTKDGENYPFVDGDSCRFAMKKSIKDSRPLISKQIPIDTLHLRLESTETKILEASSTPYVYDIQVTFADGTVNTVIALSKLYVMEEVD